MAVTGLLSNSTLSSLTPTSNPELEPVTSPAATLPFDLLERIFVECIFGSDFDKDIMRAIALVCTHWYHVLFDSHLAWSRICFLGTELYKPLWNAGTQSTQSKKSLTTVNELRRWLQHAGSRPLQISLCYYRLTGESLGDILNAVFSRATRIRRLDLALDISSSLMAYPGSIKLDEIATMLSKAIPDLRVLSIKHDLHCSDLTSYTPGPGPNLVSLLRGDIGHPWPALTTLELPEGVFMDKILPGGATLIPAVRTIALHGSFSSSAPRGANAPARIAYPNVTFLSLRISGIATVLRRVDMPNLRVLMLGDARRVVSPQDWAAVCMFINVCKPRLAALYLDNVNIDPAALVCTISQLPYLRRLVVANTQYTGDFVRRLIETRHVSCARLEDLAVSPSPFWAQLEDVSISQSAAWTLARMFIPTGWGLQRCSMGEYALRNCHREDERTWYWESEGTQTWWSAVRFEQDNDLSVHAAEPGAA